MSDEPLLKRLTELRAAASPGPWKTDFVPEYTARLYGQHDVAVANFGSVGSDRRKRHANAALAAPSHEYVACVEALIRMREVYYVAADAHDDGCTSVHTEAGTCDCGTDALDTLAKALGVEA